jgi:hypothetical protein
MDRQGIEISRLGNGLFAHFGGASLVHIGEAHDTYLGMDICQSQTSSNEDTNGKGVELQGVVCDSHGFG